VCHLDSPAPEVPDDVAEHSERTGGPDPVPYLRVDPAGSAAGAGSAAATIVLVTDIYGINPFYRHLAATLAGQGYRVIIPDVFHRVGPATDASRDAALSRRQLLDDRLAVADIERVLGHVTDENTEYGVLGFCLGGSFALLTAAARPHQVTVTYYAFPKGAPGAKIPVTEPLQVAGAIAGPVLAHWGRDDYIDAGEIGQLAKALAGAPGAADVRWYDRAGHAFLAGLTDPGHEAAEAAADSWDRTVRFFREHLAPSQAR
jgi:carboxymethylenebutenolidase